MSTVISAAKAKEYILNYRKDLPPGEMRSAWVNRDIIDAIIGLSSTNALDGIRIYLARYTEDDPGARFVKDTDTVIFVPTEENASGDAKDIKTAYFNYTRICPPVCKDDIE